MTSDGLAPRADRNRRRLWLARRPHAPDVERRMGHGRHAGIAGSRPPHTSNRSNAMSLEENTAHRSTADRKKRWNLERNRAAMTKAFRRTTVIKQRFQQEEIQP